MDWVLYDNSLRHERVKDITTSKGINCDKKISETLYLFNDSGNEEQITPAEEIMSK